MEILGIELGVTVALLLGTADILVTLSARRWRTFKTTFVSQSIGLLALLAFGVIAFWRWHLPFTWTAFAITAPSSVLLAACVPQWAISHFIAPWR